MSDWMCKGSLSLGTGCMKCVSCQEQLNESLLDAMHPKAYAWRYRAAISGTYNVRWNMSDDRDMIQTLVESGKFLVEPLFLTEKTPIDTSERDALIKIAFDPDVSDLAANPSRWASIIAYLALGGRIAGGKKLDTQQDVLGRLK